MGAALGCPALLDALEVHLLKLLTRRQALKVACLPIQARESLSTLQQLLHRRTGLPSCYVVYCAQSKNKLYVHSPMRNHLCYLVVRRWPCRGTRSGEQCAPGCAGDSAARPRRAARREAGRCSGGSGRRSRAAPAARACWLSALRATRCWSWTWPQVHVRRGSVPRPRCATRHAACGGRARRTRLLMACLAERCCCSSRRRVPSAWHHPGFLKCACSAMSRPGCSLLLSCAAQGGLAVSSRPCPCPDVRNDFPFHFIHVKHPLMTVAPCQSCAQPAPGPSGHAERGTWMRRTLAAPGPSALMRRTARPRQALSCAACA